MPGVLGTGAEAPDYFLRKTWSFFARTCWGTWFFSEEIMQQGLLSEVSSMLHYFFKKKMIIFFWRNNEAHIVPASYQHASLFLQKKWSFFSEEIMRKACLHATWPAYCILKKSWGKQAFMPHHQLMVSWRRREESRPSRLTTRLLYSEEIMWQAGHHATPPAPHYFFRKKCLLFSEEIKRQTGHVPPRQRLIISSENMLIAFWRNDKHARNFTGPPLQRYPCQEQAHASRSSWP